MHPELQERIHLLWDELADMDATRFDAVADHLMTGLCELVDAQNAVWVGSVRLGEAFPADPVRGWRASVFHYLHPTPLLGNMAREQVKDLYHGVADATTIANVANAGRFRANRLRDLVPDDWFESDFYQRYYLGLGRYDAVFVAFPVNEDAESWFGIFREMGCPHFTCDERDTLAYALRGLKWFHRQLMLSHGLLIASKPLTPAERRVLQLLLSRASEKEISHSLGLTANSVHQYVVAVFRKFGVNSRAALMSLWLGAT
jgi:DNA-binding CsgD family transcriptional regulator